MKNKSFSFILAALSMASAFASGTVTAPTANVAIDSPFNYTLFLDANNIHFDQSLRTTDPATFTGLSSQTPSGSYGFRVVSNNGGDRLRVAPLASGSGVVVDVTDDAESTTMRDFYLGGNDQTVILAGGGAQVDSTGLETPQLKVGFSPVPISQIRIGQATFSSGVATISDSTVTLNTKLFLGLHYNGNTSYGEYFRTPGTSITVRSTYGSDASTFDYLLIEP